MVGINLETLAQQCKVPVQELHDRIIFAGIALNDESRLLNLVHELVQHTQGVAERDAL